jgi:transposase
VEVAIGVDSHKASLAAAVVDLLGRVIVAEDFPNSPEGHEALLAWVRGQSPDRRIGIECSLSYGAAATRFLLAHREDVREVPSSLTARQRRRRSQGKSDVIDSVAIARVVAAEEALPSAGREAPLSDLRLLVDYRDQLVRAKTLGIRFPEGRTASARRGTPLPPSRCVWTADPQCATRGLGRSCCVALDLGRARSLG